MYFIVNRLKFNFFYVIFKEVSMQAQGNVTAAPVTLKPGVGSSYGNGWKQLWPHFLALFLIGVIYIVISMVFSVPQGLAGLGSRADILVATGFLISFLGFFYSDCQSNRLRSELCLSQSRPRR
jgi:hypothetical protein